MKQSAEDMRDTLDKLIDTFGDRKIVDEDGNEVTFVDYDRHSSRYRDGNIFIIKTEDN